MKTRKIKLFFKRNSSTIVSCIGAIGVVATTGAAIFGTIKAVQVLEEAELEKGAKLENLEKAQVVAPYYIPTLVIGASTVFCIYGANRINKQKQASLISAYALLQNSFKQYKSKVLELYGNEADTRVNEAICNDHYEIGYPEIDSESGKCLFYDAYSDRYFESTLADVQYAEYHFNRNFVLRGYADINEFYRFLEIDTIPGGDVVGWSMEAGAMIYGYQWVDFYNVERELEDGTKYYHIHMPFQPTADYIETEDYFFDAQNSQILL